MEIRRLDQTDFEELAKMIEDWNRSKAHALRMGRTLGGGWQSNLVAIVEGRIVGWIEGTHNSPPTWNRFHDLSEDVEGPGSSFVEFIYVREGSKRKRVGSDLLGAFEREALDHNNSFIGLAPQAGENLFQIQAFCRAQGYRSASEGRYSYLMGKSLV